MCGMLSALALRCIAGLELLRKSPHVSTGSVCRRITSTRANFTRGRMPQDALMRRTCWSFGKLHTSYRVRITHSTCGGPMSPSYRHIFSNITQAHRPNMTSRTSTGYYQLWRRLVLHCHWTTNHSLQDLHRRRAESVGVSCN